MDGYYEWRANPDPTPEEGPQDAVLFAPRRRRMLFMAGLWSVWKPAKDATRC